jgi:hypothetical protein
MYSLEFLCMVSTQPADGELVIITLLTRRYKITYGRSAFPQSATVG